MSPNNEEATSQDFSGGEASNNVSDYSGHHQVYNMIYPPGYYVNGVCPSHGKVTRFCSEQEMIFDKPSMASRDVATDIDKTNEKKIDLR